MTREKVIYVLEDYGHYESFGDKTYHEAFVVAIEALKQPEIIRCWDCEYYPCCESEIDDPDGYCSCAYPKIKR